MNERTPETMRHDRLTSEDDLANPRDCDVTTNQCESSRAGPPLYMNGERAFTKERRICVQAASGRAQSSGVLSTANLW